MRTLRLLPTDLPEDSRRRVKSDDPPCQFWKGGKCYRTNQQLSSRYPNNMASGHEYAEKQCTLLGPRIRQVNRFLRGELQRRNSKRAAQTAVVAQFFIAAKN